jgi:hypothetical protein
MALKLTGALIALVLACVGFQLFFRFQYVASAGGPVVRVDRLTGDSCVVFRCDYYWSLGSPAFVPDATAPPVFKPLPQATP